MKKGRGVSMKRIKKTVSGTGAPMAGTCVKNIINNHTSMGGGVAKKEGTRDYLAGARS